MISAIKRSNSDASIEGLFGYGANDVENEKSIEVVGESNVKLALGEFVQTLNLGIGGIREDNTNLILSANELGALFDMIKKYENHDNYSIYSGLYVSRLIQNSYDAGFNGFKFDLENNCHVHRLFREIKGTKERPVIVDIKGNANGYFGFFSDYLDVAVLGGTGKFFGYKSTNLIARVKGDVGSNFCWDSTNVTVAIDGNIGSLFADDAKNFSGFISSDDIDLDGSISYKEVKFGKRARENETYIKMMDELDERLRQ
jgi:hypothetical protein